MGGALGIDSPGRDTVTYLAKTKREGASGHPCLTPERKGIGSPWTPLTKSLVVPLELKDTSNKCPLAKIHLEEAKSKSTKC